MARFPRELGWACVLCSTLAASQLPGQAVDPAAGDVPRPYFGVQARDANSSMARRLGIHAEQGVFLSRILPDSSPEQAGLKAGGVSKLPPGWVIHHAGGITLSLPPDWTAEHGMPAGNAMWRLGKGDSPKASLALVRNQPWEHFSARVESPDHRQAAIAGMRADVYEGVLAGGRLPARLRIVVLHPNHPLDDELTWVCFAQTDAWARFASDLDAAFATLKFQ